MRSGAPLLGLAKYILWGSTSSKELKIRTM